MPINKTFNNTSYSIPLEGELNWATLSDFLVALADNTQTITKQKIGTRVATATPVTVLATTDCLIVTDLSVAGAVAVNLPAGVTGQMFTIVDGKGDAGTNNITVTPAAGNINGAATYVIDSNRAGVTLVYNGTQWTVTAEFISAGDIPRNQIASGSANHVVINDGSGDLSSEAALAASRGGLGTSGAAFTGYVQATAGVFSAAAIAAGDLPSSIDAAKIADGSVSSTEFQYINSLSSNAQTQISDRVVGAASSTDNALPRFDLATGKVIQNSGIIVDDSNNVTGVNDLTVNNNLTVSGTTVTMNVATLDVEDVNITVNKGGNDASSAGAGITVDRTGTKGSIIYDNATTSKFKAGDLAAEVEIATISGAQVITNKDIDGGTASNTSRITVPKAAKSALDVLTRKEGTLVYASDLDKLYADDGSTLKEIGSGGSGINYLADYFTADTIGTVGNGNVTDTGNRGTGTFSAWQSTNTTNINLTVSSSSPLRSPNCYLFTSGGTPASATGATFVESPAFNLHVADLGKPVMVSFDLADVTAEGNFDVCMVRYNSSGVYQEKISIAGNASGATPASAKLPLGITKFNGFFVASSTSTDYYALRIRRLAGTDVPRMDSIKISPDSVVQGAAVSEIPVPTITWANATGLTITTTNLKAYRVGSRMHLMGTVSFAGSGSSAGALGMSLTGYSWGTTNQVAGWVRAEQNSTSFAYNFFAYKVSSTIVEFYTQNNDAASVNLKGNTISNATSGEYQTFYMEIWLDIDTWSDGVVLANRAVEEYAYNSSLTTAADTSSFAYGMTGVAIQAFAPAGTANIQKDVQFTTPIQESDTLILEFNQGGFGWSANPFPIDSNDAGTTFVGANLITLSNTKVAVRFYSAAFFGQAWSGLSTVKWRVRKVSGGAAVGYPINGTNLLEAKTYQILTATSTISCAPTYVLYVGNGSSITFNLTTAVGINGTLMRFKNIHSTSLTIDANSSETIDGAATKSLAQWATCTLMAYEGNWVTVA